MERGIFVESRTIMTVSLGARASTESTRDVIERFNDAFNSHDVGAIMALMTEDCIFENTSPAPDGERHIGQGAVRAFWDRMFRATPTAHFETEDMFVTDDRCAVLWRYTYTNAEGEPRHIRGIDVFRVRDGKVAAKLAYVKG